MSFVRFSLTRTSRSVVRQNYSSFNSYPSLLVPAAFRHRMSTSATHSSNKRLNKLASAKSPYLLQHAENPVDWFEWGPEAFQKAQEENKPIFLSVGYSACHWCHVLAHESFEDEETAKLMNQHYINVKVDREERPDVDRLYMTFLQATAGGGGWPMSVWLTPNLHPFFAGTYWPRAQFQRVLSRLAELWEEDPGRLIESGQQIVTQLQSASSLSPGEDAVSITDASATIYKRLAKIYDAQNGGFGGAPKFPSPAQTLHFLARYASLYLADQNTAAKAEAQNAREMAINTLVKIYNGGIRDVVGGGFSRYSVDDHWHVPHFEKMLYDEAQLLSSALELVLILPTDSPQRKMLNEMATDIINYVARDLRSPEGGFYSAEDADSLPSSDSTIKKEGAFYVWSAAQMDELLGGDAEMFKQHYGVKLSGNCDPKHDIHGELTGLNVLYTAQTVEQTAQQYGQTPEQAKTRLNICLVKLKDYRDKHRPRPHLDDKILTCWNGLMISGLSKAAEVLIGDSVQALQLAEDSAKFIRENLYDEKTGELRRSYRQGPGPIGQADDYAFLIQGLLDLYEASGKEVYVTWAIRLQEKQDELFYDKAGDGYFASAPDPHIIVRMKDAQDGAEPSAVSVTLHNLQRLSHFAEDRHGDYQEKAQSILKSNSQLLAHAPFALATMVGAAVLAEKGYKQFIVSGRPDDSTTKEFLRAIRNAPIMNRILVHLDPNNPPHELAKLNGTLRALLEKAGEKQSTVRVCENFTCGLPVTTVSELGLPNIE